MSDELDKACARAMGWGDTPYVIGMYNPAGQLDAVPQFSTDANDARLLEDEIERRGLQSRYIAHLMLLVLGKATPITGSEPAVWAALRAKPDERARAFRNTVSTPTLEDTQVLNG